MANTIIIEQSAEWRARWVHQLLATIEIYPGMAVDQELRACWSRLAWKHASQYMGQYPQELI